MRYNFLTLKRLPFRFVLQLFIVAGLIVFVLLLIFQQRLTDTQNDFFVSEDLKMRVEQLNTAFPQYLDARRGEDFFLYGYDSETEKIENYIESIYIILLQHKPGEELTEIGITGDDNRVKELIESFHKDFERLIAAEKSIGNDNYGIIQGLNDAGLNLKVYQQFLNDTTIRNDTETLSELGETYKKDYSENIMEEYLKLSEELLNKLKPRKGELPGDKEAELIKAIEIHRTRILALNDAGLKLGRNNQEGIKAQAFEALNELRQISDEYFDLQGKNFVSVSERIRTLTFMFFAFLIVIPLILGRWLYVKVRKRMDHIDILLQYLKEGEIERFDYPIEIESFPLIKTIEQIFNALKKKNQHIINIASGQLNMQAQRYELHDVLGQSIIRLEESVLQAQEEKEEELRKKETEDRRIRGLAAFAGIMRENAGRAESLAQAVISELVHFLDIQLGGFYILDPSEEPPVYRLIAAYAYDEKKVLTKTVESGIGLIGTAASDKIPFYYDDLPEDYLKIITGFGQAPPKSLYIQPLISGDTVVGVLELASLTEFETHHIEFIESLAADIASALRYIVLEQESAEFKF